MSTVNDDTLALITLVFGMNSGLGDQCSCAHFHSAHCQARQTSVLKMTCEHSCDSAHVFFLRCDESIFLGLL